ncbi:MAG: hypothetical protein H6985_10510 [Pseudomonadales bacterium]|nr:hypothetical protein [Pseudomonadales bacterium]
MNCKLGFLLVATLCAGSAWADLKPDIIDCNSKKAARNAALEATVGVSGHCDPGELAKDTREDVADGARDKVDEVTDLKPTPLERDKGKGKLRQGKD